MSEPKFHMFPAAPEPVAPFSHAVEADGWVQLTGQMPTDPDHPSKPMPDGIEAQTRRVMDNLALVLGELGLGLEHVTSARAFLTPFARDYAAMNEASSSSFPAHRPPPRARLRVGARAGGALVRLRRSDDAPCPGTALRFFHHDSERDVVRELG